MSGEGRGRTSLRRAGEALARAVSGGGGIAILTGAGVSAESGIPTFRGERGLWKSESEVAALATPEGFARDPERVWEWYHARRREVATARPNPGHLALASLEEAGSKGGGPFTLVTQNIDGLHQAAGSRKVLELHGNILRSRCEGCGVARDLPQGAEGVPACPGCGDRLRPDVVWFGEPLPPGIFEEAVRSARSAGLFLVAGTSGVVQPAASLASWAKRAGASLIEVNLEATPMSRIADLSLFGRTGELLPALAREAGIPPAPNEPGKD